METVEQRLSKATPEQLEQLMGMNLERKFKLQVQAEIDKRSQPATPPPQVQPQGPGYPDVSFGGFASNLGNSFVNNAQGMLMGVGNLFTSPIDTITGMPSGLVSHYGSRYNSPEQAAQTAYNDPVGAAMDVPVFGTGLRILSAAGKVGGMGRAADIAGQVGRGMERVDPFGLVAGGVQGGVGALMNRTMPNRTPEAVMAGTEYGGVQGRQKDYLNEYYDDVGRALDEGYGNTLADLNAAEAAVEAAKVDLGVILDDAAGTTMRKVDLIKALEGLKSGKSPHLDQAYIATIDNTIKEVLDAADPMSPNLTPSQVNDIKSKFQSKTNWNAVDGGELDATQALADASRVARQQVRDAVPEAAGALDEVRQLSTVEDLVRRGHIGEMPNVGGGTAGSFLAQGVDLLAPIMTGQRKNVRNSIRRDIREGNLRSLEGVLRYGSAANKLTERTLYGPLREGAYLAEIERTQDPDQKWHVGRLWSE